MALKCFNLKDVPEDEANEIRELLRINNIDFYETPAGKWGISMPALWLNNESDKETTAALIHQYQSERVQNARKQLDYSLQQGTKYSLNSRFKQRPVLFIITLIMIGFILYFSIKPFLTLGS